MTVPPGYQRIQQLPDGLSYQGGIFRIGYPYQNTPYSCGLQIGNLLSIGNDEDGCMGSMFLESPGSTVRAKKYHYIDCIYNYEDIRLGGTIVSEDGIFRAEVSPTQTYDCALTKISNTLGTDMDLELYHNSVFRTQDGDIFPITRMFGRRLELPESPVHISELPDTITYLSMRKTPLSSDYIWDSFVIQDLKKFPRKLNSIAEYSFIGLPYSNPSFIGTTISEIGDFAFKDCEEIRELHFANTNMLSIHNNSFMGCTSLQTVSFLNISSVALLDDPFPNCTSLREIDLSAIELAQFFPNICYGCSDVTLKISSTTAKLMRVGDGEPLTKDSPVTVEIVGDE